MLMTNVFKFTTWFFFQPGIPSLLDIYCPNCSIYYDRLLLEFHFVFYILFLIPRNTHIKLTKYVTTQTCKVQKKVLLHQICLNIENKQT